MCHHLLHSVVTLWVYKVINICYNNYNQNLPAHNLAWKRCIYTPSFVDKWSSKLYPDTKCNNMSMHIHWIDIHLCVVNTNLARQLMVLSPQVRSTVDTAYRAKTRSVNMRLYTALSLTLAVTHNNLASYKICNNRMFSVSRFTFTVLTNIGKIGRLLPF